MPFKIECKFREKCEKFFGNWIAFNFEWKFSEKCRYNCLPKNYWKFNYLTIKNIKKYSIFLIFNEDDILVQVYSNYCKTHFIIKKTNFLINIFNFELSHSIYWIPIVLLLHLLEKVCYKSLNDFLRYHSLNRFTELFKDKEIQI